MTLYEIARLTAASQMMPPALATQVPRAFEIDSRAVQPGDLFLAIPGARVDGHRYLDEAFQRGAAAALVMHHHLPGPLLPERSESSALPASQLGLEAGPGIDPGRLLFVEQTVCALQLLAARVLAKWARPVVGITGSAGKTTIKELTAHILEGMWEGQVLKSPGNLNTGYGLPLAVSRMICGGRRPDQFRVAVLEMGMNGYGEIARLTDLATPQIGVVANVGTAHLEFFGSVARIARAKAEMVEGIAPQGVAVLNADDPRTLAMRALRSDVRVVTFGLEAGTADVRATKVQSEPDLQGTSFLLTTSTGTAPVRLPLIGRHNISNALAAAAVADVLEMKVEQIAARLSTAAPAANRGVLIHLSIGEGPEKGVVTIVDDSYNSNPQALLEAVRAISGREERRSRARRIVVAGEMLELGPEGPTLHRASGREIAANGIDLLIGVRGLAAELVEGAVIEGGMARQQTRFFEQVEEASHWLLTELQPGDLILVKGSRGVRLEQLVRRLVATLAPASALS
jgi:UDP-N-acetylmuramoyl-tripeptide--D-alanyl-D-alanine ligase